MSTTKLNGSSDLLANAIRKVFEETMKAHENNMKPEFEKIDKRLEALEAGQTKLGEQIDQTNKNMADQFSEQDKRISDIVDKKLERFTLPQNKSARGTGKRT